MYLVHINGGNSIKLVREPLKVLRNSTIHTIYIKGTLTYIVREPLRTIRTIYIKGIFIYNTYCTYIRIIYTIIPDFTYKKRGDSPKAIPPFVYIENGSGSGVAIVGIAFSSLCLVPL